MSAEGALALFDPLPLTERWFVRARYHTAPLRALAAAAPREGHLLDAGCGHGLVSALLATEGQRTVLGVDPDPRKIELARDSVGRLPNVELRVATLEQLGEQGAFDAVVVADVLYLLPLPSWPSFLGAARRLLRPRGRLLLKEAEADGSWRHKKTLLQEQLMVRVMRKTHSSGGLGFLRREALVAQVQAAGFWVSSVTALGAGYSTPHLLLCAERV